MKQRVILYLLVFSIILTPYAHAAPSAAKTYAKRAHEAFENKNFQLAGVFYEKAYNEDKNKVYLENSVIAYLRYAFDSLNEKKYEDAIKYCERVLFLEPGNKDAREILSDIYYSRGSSLYYRGDEQKAASDLKKSLKYSILAEQKQRAQKLLSKISVSISEPVFLNPFAKKTSGYDVSSEALELMELKIYGETFERYSIYERTGRLEKDVFGRTYAGNGLAFRIKNLKARILPENISRDF